MISCPQCNTEIVKPRCVTPGCTPETGDLFICPGCCTLSEYDAELVPVLLTQEKFDALSPAEKRDIKFAVRSMSAHAKRLDRINRNLTL